jgi:hypothetical protein
MIKNTKLYEALSDFIDAVASEDHEVEVTAIKNFIGEKTQMQLEAGASKKYTLDGDDVMCDGKKVGCITSDDADKKITFKDEDGESKEFDSLPKLYAYLGKDKEDGDGSDDDTEVKESAESGLSRAKKAVDAPKPAKSDRSKRFDAVRNKKQPDGKAGEYDKKDPRSSEHKDSKK